MFARPVAFLYAFFALVVLAAATPNPENMKRWGTPTTTPATTKTITITETATSTATSIPASSCSTGPIQCCDSVTSASDPAASLLLGLLGIVLDAVDVLVGLTCSPVSVIGVGGGSCNANVVCCENNSVGGLISIGCVPVIL